MSSLGDYTLEELETAADPKASTPNWRETFGELQQLGIDARAVNPPTTCSYGEGENGLIAQDREARP